MNALQHLELLLRYDRALNLRLAIERAVRPRARVLDAGCGAGLLSCWAVQAGAQEVVGIDLDSVELARDLARANGLADATKFLQGDLWSMEGTGRPNGFDTIIAMIYLNDPRRDEGQCELTYGLRDRCLASGGKIVPDRVRYVARGGDWPSQDHATRISHVDARIRDLEGRYGLRFQALRERVVGNSWKSFFPQRRADGRLDFSGRILSDPALFADVNYSNPAKSYPETFELLINAPGVLNTILWTQELWFENLLLFSNESVSWVAEPCFVEERARCTVQIDDTWRRQNLLTVLP